MAKVIGWATYDDRYRSAEITPEVNHAIIAEIRAHGYRFSAWEHQERQRCAPLMDDMRLARFSREAWASLMVACHHADASAADKRFYFVHYKLDDKVPDTVIPGDPRDSYGIDCPVSDELFEKMKGVREMRMLLPICDETRERRAHDCLRFLRENDPEYLLESVDFAFSSLYAMDDLADFEEWRQAYGEAPLDEGTYFAPMPVDTAHPFLYIPLEALD